MEGWMAGKVLCWCNIIIYVDLIELACSLTLSAQMTCLSEPIIFKVLIKKEFDWLKNRSFES